MKKYLVSLLIMMIFCLNGKVMAKALPGYENYQRVEPYETMDEEGTLILSNSPETVKEIGILYKDQFCGKTRLVFHHVNATGANDKKLQIVIKNLSNDTQMLIINREGYAEPLYHYLKAGDNLLKAYFKSHQSKVFFIKPHDTFMLYDSYELDWKPQMVLSGMIDVYTPGRLEVTFAMMQREQTIEEMANLKYLDMDLAPRGTFDCLTKCHSLCLMGGQDTYYLIEDEKKDWIKGIDALTGKQVVNYGNYGVLYKIKIMAGEDTTVFVCPRGGIFQGTIQWEDGSTQEIIRNHVFKTKKERVNIGEIKKGQIRTLHYMLPNGSAAPVLIGFDIKN